MEGYEGFTNQRLSSATWLSHFCASARRFKSFSPPSAQTAVHSTSGGHSLVRRLGLFDLILLGVGASIGAGVFVVTGTVARDAGPGVTISFLLAGASCVLNALCYAELASRFPAVVGGAYMYSYSAFNEITAFLVFVQLMLDYHIGAASISRSLASYAVALLELFPALRDSIPLWIGSGQELLGGFFSLNILAPILLALLTLVLCQGVRESSTVNSVMTATKVVIVLVVICAGAFEIDVANWSPFAPNGFKAILTGATVVFFSYVGFDAVANSAEESKNPQRDLPIGIMGSLLVCISLYIGVCLVLTGMVPFSLLSEDAPLAEAFTSKGMKFVSILISIGAVVGLTTTLLVGLYVQVIISFVISLIPSHAAHANQGISEWSYDASHKQSRLYLGLGRDGLLPSIFSRIHPTLHTPLHSQIWCGIVAAVLAGVFNVHSLSHILSVGTLTGYSVVAACVVVLRLYDKEGRDLSSGWTSSWQEGVICLVMIACSGFGAGVFYRFSASVIFLLLSIGVAVVASAILHFRQAYAQSPGSGFRCPGVPIVPCVCIFFNIFLFAQLHYEAWIRFVVVSVLATVVYALYGQYHADTSTLLYQRAPDNESESG